MSLQSCVRSIRTDDVIVLWNKICVNNCLYTGRHTKQQYQSLMIGVLVRGLVCMFRFHFVVRKIRHVKCTWFMNKE